MTDSYRYSCSHCGWTGALAALDAAGRRQCPACGHALQETDDDVIDVNAVPIGGLPAEIEPDYDADPFFDPAQQDRPPEYGWQGQTVHFERSYRSNGGCGCCLGGLLLAAFLLYLLFRGAASVFFG